LCIRDWEEAKGTYLDQIADLPVFISPRNNNKQLLLKKRASGRKTRPKAKIYLEFWPKSRLMGLLKRVKASLGGV
jgi:hypothetical protein